MSSFFFFCFVANSVRQSMFVCFELGEIFLKKEGVDSLQRCDWNINIFFFSFFRSEERGRETMVTKFMGWFQTRALRGHHEIRRRFHRSTKNFCDEE